MTRLMRATAIAAACAVLLIMTLGCADDAVTTRAADAETHETAGGEHSDRGEGGVVRLRAEDLGGSGLETAVAGPGELEITVELPGEVRVNGDQMAHVSPRVSGVAREVLVSLGDSVRAGQLLAVLESRELADAKAAYLAASERLGLAEATFSREERLWRERVSAEQDYLDASTALAEARIALRTAEQKLHALGFGERWLEGLSDEPEAEYTWYRLTAPFDGEVIDRHLTVGETVSAEEPVFTVADLATVWIDLSVYQKDLGAVAAGQRVRFEAASDGQGGTGTIAFVQPLLGEETRTALARVVSANPDRRWRPGMFVSAEIVTDRPRVEVMVPPAAVIRMPDGDDVVFVETADGFVPSPVDLGRRSREGVEVLSGLEAGERYVAAGGFSLKAELAKSSFGDGHGH